MVIEGGTPSLPSTPSRTNHRLLFSLTPSADWHSLSTYTFTAFTNCVVCMSSAFSPFSLSLPGAVDYMDHSPGLKRQRL
jgi:hypothetical protein